MKKAQKKPVVIEFIQLKENNLLEVYKEVFGKAPELLSIMEITQIASIGDYIVFGHSEKLGRHCWPVKPDYFENAYDVITN